MKTLVGMLGKFVKTLSRDLLTLYHSAVEVALLMLTPHIYPKCCDDIVGCVSVTISISQHINLRKHFPVKIHRLKQ